jgi:hypothetical protein
MTDVIHKKMPAAFDRTAEQCRTVPTSSARIMRQPNFKLGLNDVREGRPFRDLAEEPNAQWAYERGRLFGVVAPVSMPLFITDDSRRLLNPKALRLFEVASDRGYIR